MLIIHRQRFVVVLATTTLSWWWFWLLSSSSLLLLISVATAIDSSSSSSSLLTTETTTLQQKHIRSQQRQQQRQEEEEDGNDNDLTFQEDEDETEETTTIDDEDDDDDDEEDDDEDDTTTNPGDITINIVGGTPVDPSRYPFYFVANNATANSTSTSTTGIIQCGGTLIHPDIVLTAASCANVFTVGRSVYIGGKKISRFVEKTFAHPAYVAADSYHNIMLVKLKGTSDAKTVRLNRFRHLSWPQRPVSVIGYGSMYVNGGGGVSPVLRRARLWITRKAQCKASFKTLYDPRTELCAGARRGEKGSCNGDMGGPLLEGRRVQHGISTYISSPCGRDRASDGFTRVSRYYEWIWYYACELTAVKKGKCHRWF